MTTNPTLAQYTVQGPVEERVWIERIRQRIDILTTMAFRFNLPKLGDLAIFWMGRSLTIELCCAPQDFSVGTEPGKYTKRSQGVFYLIGADDDRHPECHMYGMMRDGTIMAGHITKLGFPSYSGMLGLELRQAKLHDMGILQHRALWRRLGDQIVEFHTRSQKKADSTRQLAADIQAEHLLDDLSRG